MGAYDLVIGDLPVSINPAFCLPLYKGVLLAELCTRVGNFGKVLCTHPRPKFITIFYFCSASPTTIILLALAVMFLPLMFVGLVN